MFKIAKQITGEKGDSVGVNCLKDETEAMKVSVDDQKKIWKEHMEKLMNVENGVIALIASMLEVEGTVKRIEVEEVRYVMNRMGSGKQVGPL